MTRLYLHGRLGPLALSQRLEQARKRSIPPLSLLLSGWCLNDDEKIVLPEGDDDVDSRLEWNQMVTDLCTYLKELDAPIEEVTLQNCTGDLEKIVATILLTCRNVTIRYDLQQSSIPLSIAHGLINGCCGNARIRSLSLRGMTLTEPILKLLQSALPKYIALDSLSIHGKFLLRELEERKYVSILAGWMHSPFQPASTANRLAQMLQHMPNLQSLNLENCHIPDKSLAHLLEMAVHSKRLTTLKLRGNLVQTFSMVVLQNYLKKERCPLKHLDLSWQRMPFSKRNCSILPDLPLLCYALTKNTSLRTLILSENQLLDPHIAKLAHVLEQNVTLKTLELVDCRISNIHVLAKSLPKFHLQRLNLSDRYSPASSRQWKHLFLQSLSQNVYLYDLILPQQQSKRVEWLLEWNRAGRRILVEEDVPHSFWPLVLERADRIGRQQYASTNPTKANQHGAAAIYCLLRERNASLISSP